VPGPLGISAATVGASTLIGQAVGRRHAERSSIPTSGVLNYQGVAYGVAYRLPGPELRIYRLRGRGCASASP